jgi:hypothetical protein
MRTLCLLIASLMLSACAASPPASVPWTPPLLDSALAAPCPLLGQPASDGYDDWQGWMENVVLPAYADCAIRHDGTVRAWPK